MLNYQVNCLQINKYKDQNCLTIKIPSLILAGDDAEICEIAAAEGKNTFQVYILPSNSITPAASAVNKLTVRSGVLHYDGKPVSSTSLAAGLSDLLQWLEARQPCLLIAHNAKAFDAKHLVKAVTSSDLLPKFSQVVLGFSDTLPAFRQLFPDRASCSQEYLAQDLLERTYNAHSTLFHSSSYESWHPSISLTSLCYSTALQHPGWRHRQCSLPRRNKISKPCNHSSAQKQCRNEWRRKQQLLA